MKNKKTDRKAFSFHSISAPCDFAVRIKEKAVELNLEIEQNDADFILHLDSDHVGKIVYKAIVAADESGGSYISGEITTIPWSDKPPKKKSMIEKIFSIVGYIVLIPSMLIFFLCYGIYTLFVRLFRGKTIEVTNEEKLCDFMTNKMSCRQAKE